MRDFTLETYRELLLALKQAGYVFVTMEELAQRQAAGTQEKCVCLRHDVDLHAERSLRTAQIENAMGIRAVYYFRVVPASNQPGIIRQIVALGHEVGYHYEDMSICDGDVVKAYAHFEEHLAYFRKFYPVRTICMHGAPTSRYDGRDLWQKYDYKALGLVCEPYLDLDYSRLFYITDTGRRWDGYKVSLRDKIPVYQDEWVKQGLVFHTTQDLLNALSPNGTLRQLPQSLLITTHPQRWTSTPIAWWKELLMQSAKNVIKRLLVRK